MPKKTRWNIWVYDWVKERAMRIISKYPVPKTDGEFVSHIIDQIPETPPDPFIPLSFAKLPEDFEEFLQKIIYYIQQEQEARLKSRAPNELWVSELVVCPAKREMALKYPQYAKIPQPRLLLGILVHLGVRFFARAAGYEYEVPVKIIISVDGVDYTVTGRADVFDPARGIVWDVKSGRSVYDPPSPHHALQVYIYQRLLKAKEGRVLYLTGDRFCEVKITDGHVVRALQQAHINDVDYRDVDELLRHLIVIHIKKLLTPLWSWECDYCNFKVVCPYYVKPLRR